MKRALLVLFIFAAVAICYWPAMHGQILWDDPAHVPRAELQSWSGLGRIWTETRATQQYYPVLFSAFWFEHKLWGDATFGYHLVNLIWHATSACLVAFLLRQIWNTPTRVASGQTEKAWHVPLGTEWWIAAIFALHPIAVESVAWITEQKNTLSTLFYLGAGLCYWRFQTERRGSAYALASVLFVLALGSKTATVTLPAALLVVIWWKNGALSRRDWQPLIPWFVAAIGMGLFTSWVERKFIGADGVVFDLSLGLRTLLAGRVLWFYVGKLLWPANLSFFYPRWDVAGEASHWIFYAAAGVILTVLLWRLRHRSRAPLAAWLIFAGTLFPILGFFKVFFFVFSYVNDHFAYLASLGFFSAIVSFAAAGVVRGPIWARRGGALFCAGLVAILGCLTYRRSALYQSNEILFRATRQENPRSWMAHVLLGFALGAQPDQRDAAIREYRTALALNPDYAEAHVGLATELLKRPEDEDEAMREFREALRLRPSYVEAHVNLAVLLAKNPSRLAEAVEHYEAALAIRPDFAETHNDLANTLARIPGRLTDAMSHYEAALRWRPNYAEAENNYAVALAKIPGRAEEAREHYQSALRLNPRLAAAHHNFARFLASQPGHQSEALEHAEQAAQLEPTNVEMQNTLAVILAQSNQLEKARAHWNEALRLNPNYETARRNLRRLDEAGPR